MQWKRCSRGAAVKGTAHSGHESRANLVFVISTALPCRYLAEKHSPESTCYVCCYDAVATSQLAADAAIQKNGAAFDTPYSATSHRAIWAIRATQRSRLSLQVAWE